jgi:hypothetical protein
MDSSQRHSRKHSRLLVLSAVVYVPTLLMARRIGDGSAILSTTLLSVAFLAGLGMIVFAVQAVRYGDELQQRIHLEALAVAFVAVVLVTFTALFAPPFLPRDLRWEDLWLLLSGFWLVGLGRAYWRRR